MERYRSDELIISGYQVLINGWIQNLGVRYLSKLAKLGILMKKVREVAQIMTRTYRDKSFKLREDSLDLADELADGLFVVCCIANQTGMDLTCAIEGNLEKNSTG